MASHLNGTTKSIVFITFLKLEIPHKN